VKLRQKIGALPTPYWQGVAKQRLKFWRNTVVMTGVNPLNSGQQHAVMAGRYHIIPAPYRQHRK
jgi:hypothetical protein